MLGGFDAAAFRRAMALYGVALREHREELDSLNVFPVPDGDTGTNLLVTHERVERALALEADDAGLDEVCRAVAGASLAGARGNSGVILSEMLRAICARVEAWGTSGRRPDPAEVAEALEHAASRAYRVVARPVEGTVLTVAREAAEAARAAAPTAGEPAEVLDAALDGARASLARTREGPPALRAAGVVDAGGKGLVLLLDALRSAARGTGLTEPVGPQGPVRRAEPPPVGDAAPPGATPTEPGYEVQFLLEVDEAAVPVLRAALAAIGESLVVVGGDGLYRVHVHTGEAVRALEAALRVGRFRDVSVGPLANGGGIGSAPAGATSLIVGAEGEGLARAFRSLGARVVSGARGGAAGWPSPAALLAAAAAEPLPAIVLAAEAEAAVLSERAAPRVRVVTVSSPVVGLSAAAAFNPAEPPEANERAMRDAAARCRWGEVLRRDGATPLGVGPGAVASGPPAGWLGVVDGRPADAFPTAGEAAVAVARGLGAGPEAEVLTLVSGAGADARDATGVERALRAAFPGLQVEVLDGGQPGPPFLIGLE